MEEAKKTNANPKMVIVGLNILILLMYTIYFRFIAPAELNILADAVAIAFHITACLVLAIFIYRREFLLSAGLVLIIGFSTCMMAYTL
ncbi:hypothetical protein A0256_12300 [Mucilaginibacter sp. PAMC 26640]|nr:hypothetical protein A0256_12300 [Mucilaginibacter sp. PAMC 26640]